MSDTIRFILDGEVREVRDVAPTMTVLEWLRERERRCGTKEGCAEGDCGACTVAIGERAGDGVRYRAVNSCIQFLPTLDGKELVTVESLKHKGKLHPVQHAMVECHGSQCGFCTPGFVMSLFTLYHGDKGTDRETVDDALAGNLCRCTGYRPIVEAAQTMRNLGAKDQFHARAAETAKQLRSIARGDTLALEKDGQRYFAPTNIEEFAAAYEQFPDAVLLGGGTDVGLWVTKLHRRLDTLIYTRDVPELNRLSVDDEFIDIGGAAPLTDCYDALAAEHADFGEMLRRFASVQVRNAGTMGGNVGNASPIGDTPPVLLALDASVRVAARRRDARGAARPVFSVVSQDGIAAGGVHRGHPHTARAARATVSRLQNLETLRPGHFRRVRRVRVDGRRLAASRGSGSRSAAWRRCRNAPTMPRRHCTDKSGTRRRRAPRCGRWSAISSR